MHRTHIYIPDDLQREIDQAARIEKKSKAAIIREALTVGLKTTRASKPSSAQRLLTMTREARKIKGTAPRDLSFNHDYYTWGGGRKNPLVN